MKLRWIPLLLATTLFGAFSASLVDASPGEVIRSCIDKKTQILRYSSNGKCDKKTETALTWSLTGPEGPVGARGSTGAQGPTGATGPAGTHVRYGIGAPASATGIDGDFYIATNTNTLYGPKASGAWPTGVSLIGATGPAGPTGATGAQGTTGAQGPTGATGPAGATGATGPIGPAGAAFLSGIGTPLSTLGNNGDMYYATDLTMMYGPKSSGSWPAGVSITGATGATGATGSGSGQNLFVVDSNLTDVGTLLDFTEESMTVLIGNAIWTLRPETGLPVQGAIVYKDSSCNNPIRWTANKLSTQARFGVYLHSREGETYIGAYKISGSAKLYSSLTNTYSWAGTWNGTTLTSWRCAAQATDAVNAYDGPYYYDMVAVPTPAITGPLTIVSR